MAETNSKVLVTLDPHNLTQEQGFTHNSETEIKLENEEVLNFQAENNIDDSATSSNVEARYDIDGAENVNLQNSGVQSKDVSNTYGSTQTATTSQEHAQTQNTNPLHDGVAPLETPGDGVAPLETPGDSPQNEKTKEEDCVDPSYSPYFQDAVLSTNTLIEPPPELVIVSREEWRAIPPKSTLPKSHPSHVIVFTYTTNSKSCSTLKECGKVARKIQRHHIRAGILDIPYNFMIGGDGRVYEGRGWFNNCRTLMQLAQVRNCVMEIAFMGDYKEERPSEQMFDSALELIEYGRQNKWIQDEFGLYENYEGPEIKPVILDGMTLDE